jgi:hypothetical protein
MPRIHHSYPGFAVLLIDYVYLQNEWFFILGFALIFSDVIHHLIFDPFIKSHAYDIGMKNHGKARHYVASLPAATAFIVSVFFELVTPFTPGSWLAVVEVGTFAGESQDHYWRKIKKILKLRK